MKTNRMEYKSVQIIAVVGVTIAFIAFSYISIRSALMAEEDRTEARYLEVAQSITAALYGENVPKLLIDEDADEFKRFWKRLERTVSLNPQFVLAALYRIRGEKLELFAQSGNYLNSQSIELLTSVLDNHTSPARYTITPKSKETLQAVSIPLVNLDTQIPIGAMVFLYQADDLRSAAWHVVRNQVWNFILLYAVLIALVLLIQNYHQLQRKEIKLRKSHEQLASMNDDRKLLVSQMPQALALHQIIYNDAGKPVDYRFLSINPKFTEITGLTEDQVVDKRLLEVLPETEPSWITLYGEVVRTGNPIVTEKYSRNFNKWFLIHAYRPKDDHFITIFEDLTEVRKKDQEIDYLAMHDTFTGMYNRKAFALLYKDVEASPVASVHLILFDINGLRAINDEYGHDMGDLLLWHLAESIREVCIHEDDITARIGGDEFVLLLIGRKQVEAKNYAQQIITNYNNRRLGSWHATVSWGFASREGRYEQLDQLIQKVENDLDEHKLAEHHTTRQQTIDVLLQTLFSKCPREKEHSSRVSTLSCLIAKHMGFSDESLEQVRLAGIMHDIGKISIDDAILNKPAKLSEEEWKEMKRHPEIGFHLLSSVTRYATFAKDVLSHHERWDGLGYPSGLSGRQIPLVSRIIAVADALDAMTCERPYRKPFNLEQARDELQRCSGFQFDPAVVSVCIGKVIN